MSLRYWDEPSPWPRRIWVLLTCLGLWVGYDHVRLRLEVTDIREEQIHQALLVASAVIGCRLEQIKPRSEPRARRQHTF